jgi:leader peptidase (prepilin peptidase) / N-methyltransferase
MEILFLIFITLFGLILGSFFNVLIWRLPREESIVWPGSHCPKCNRPIRAWENIPVLSYLFLRGRCAGCKMRISSMYPFVELITGLGALFLFQFFVWKTSQIHTPLMWYNYLYFILQGAVLLVLIPVTIIDFQHYIIPNQITYAIVPLGIIASFLQNDNRPLRTFIDMLLGPIIGTPLVSIIDRPLISLIGLVAGAGTLYGIGWLGKIVFRKGEAMGLGDVKLLAGIGALWGPKIALLAIMFASFYGTFAAIVLAVIGRLNKDHHIPFGPWLAAGTWTAVLAGDAIIDWYMALMGNVVLNGH